MAPTESTVKVGPANKEWRMSETVVKPNGGWALPIVLIVFSDIGTTLATFMPLKSVFILAADDIPSFFPAWMQALGPIGVGLLLVLFAAALGGLSAVARATVTKIDKASRPKGLPPSTPVAATKRRVGGGVLATRDETARSLFVSIMLAGVAVVSPLFATVVITWIALSWAVIAVRVHRRPRRAPFPHGRAEFAADFSEWMKLSSLWVSVGAAIVTLLTWPPVLGLTGILLGAVFSQRAQMTLSGLSLVIAPPARHQTTRLQERDSTLTSPGQLGAPFDFFGSAVGQRRLHQSMTALGWDVSQWRVVGLRSPKTASLVTRSTSDGNWLLLRVFSIRHEWDCEHELELRVLGRELERLGHDTRKPYKVDIAGLPTVVVDLGTQQPLWNETVTGEAARKWQVDWEIWSATENRLDHLFAESEQVNRLDRLKPLLARNANMYRGYQPVFRELLSEMPRIQALRRSNTRCLSLGQALRPADCIVLGNGQLWPCDLSAWTIDSLGAAWGDPAAYQHEYATAKDGPPHDDTLPSANIPFVESLVQRLIVGLETNNLELGEKTAKLLFEEIGSS